MKWVFWKWASLALVLYSIVQGFAGAVPDLPILRESIRTLYFHVPMWFAMIALLSWAAWNQIRFLQTGRALHDHKAVGATETALWFGLAGLITGMVWARFTWGEYWSGDPKQNASAMGMLLYLAYFVLRGSVNEPEKKARLSAVYGIFVFPVYLVLIFILPRLTDSLHPGNGGNPAFSSYDLDSSMRLVFYPAVLGWIGIGFWLSSIRSGLQKKVLE